MRRRISTTFLAIFAFGLFLSWGCGSGEMGQTVGVETFSGETSQVVIEAGVGSLATAASVSKDIGAEGRADAEDGIDSPVESMGMTCEITYDSATPLQAVPVVPLIEENAGTGDYSWEYSCSSAGASINKCIACRTIETGGGWLCTAHCEGMVPYDADYELDRVNMHIRFITDFGVSSALDPTGVLFRQDGRRSAENGLLPWSEADDHIDTIIDPFNSGANYDFSDCDGGDGEMALALDDPLSADPLNADALDASFEVPRSWRKNFTVSSMGDGTCVVDTLIDTYVPLTGVAGPSHRADITRDQIILSSTWCDDIDSCEAIGSGGAMDEGSGSLNMVVDGSLVEIADEAVDILPPLALGFEEQMNESTMTPSNIILLSESPGAVQPSYTIESSGTASGLFSYDIAFSESTPSYYYQNQDIRAIITGNVLSETNKTADPVDMRFQLGGAVSDNFTSDTTVNYQFGKVIVDDILPPTETDISGVLPYLSQGNSSWEHRCWELTDSAKPASDIQLTVAPTKDLIVQSSASIEIELSDIANFKNLDLGNEVDSDLLGLKITDATSGRFLFVGVRAAVAADSEIRPICEAALYDTSSGGYVSGSWRDCTGVTNANFKLEYSQEMESLVAYMADDPGGGGAYERMDGANYNGYGPFEATSLSFTDLPKDPDGMSSVGLIFNSSSGNDRTLKANVKKLEAFGWRSNSLSWEPRQKVIMIAE